MWKRILTFWDGSRDGAKKKKAYFKMQNVLVDDRRIWVDLYVSLIILYSARWYFSAKAE